MKNKILLFLSFIIISFVLYYSSTNTYKNYLKEYERVTVEEIKTIQNLDEPFLLYTGRESCPHCKIFVKKLTQIESSNISVYYLDSEDYKTNEGLKDFRAEYNIETVPNFSFFIGNRHISSMNLSDDTQTDEIGKFIKESENVIINN